MVSIDEYEDLDDFIEKNMVTEKIELKRFQCPVSGDMLKPMLSEKQVKSTAKQHMQMKHPEIVAELEKE